MVDYYTYGPFKPKVSIENDWIHIDIDTPNELFARIQEKNQIDNKSRLVAGYCWDWNSRKNPAAMDIVSPNTTSE